jgi:hypothetical protein
MVWWVDDGDNVLETDEALLSGVKTIKDMFGPNRTFTADLADATTNVWTPNTPGPVPGGETKYIAKAWCFGNMTLNRVAQDGAGKLPGSTNGPLSRGGGFTCDGTALDNKSQTDGLTMNIAFRAVQARHNPRYTCNTEQRMGTITVTKVVINDNGGNNIVSDFQLFVVDGPVIIPVTSGVPTVVPVGNYIVTETGINGYQASFSGDCNASGQVTIAEGDNKQCTVTNNDIPASITLVKNVVGGSASPIQFTMRVDGNVVPHNGSVPVTSNSPHTISEDPFPGYTFTGVSGAGCPATLPGNVILNEGQAIVCTITNTQNP